MKVGDDLARELLRFDPDLPVERAWMPPSSWYTDPAVLELEREVVFAPSWQPLARLEEVSAPGDFVSGRFLGEPWVVLRDDAGALRAFANVCSHKGREVVVGRGRAPELVCGYHAWTYGLDGALARAPGVGGIEDFDRGRCALTPLGVEAWGPWVFVNLDGAAPPLGPRLAEVEARLAATGWEDLAFVSGKRWVLECNWKVYVDNYLDGGYHIPHMHPTLDAQVDMATYRTELFDGCSIQGVAAAPDGDARIGFDASARVGPGAIYAWIHPNVMLNRYGPCLDSNHVVPLGPDRCAVDYQFFFDRSRLEGAEAFIEESIRQSDVTQEEDIAITESVQAGLRSRAYDRGRYAPLVETSEHQFHRYLALAFRRALEGGARG